MEICTCIGGFSVKIVIDFAGDTPDNGVNATIPTVTCNTGAGAGLTGSEVNHFNVVNVDLVERIQAPYTQRHSGVEYAYRSLASLDLGYVVSILEGFFIPAAVEEWEQTCIK